MYNSKSNGATRGYYIPDIEPEEVNNKDAWVCLRKCPKCNSRLHTNGKDFLCFVCQWKENNK